MDRHARAGRRASTGVHGSLTRLRPPALTRHHLALRRHTPGQPGAHRIQIHIRLRARRLALALTLQRHPHAPRRARRALRPGRVAAVVRRLRRARRALAHVQHAPLLGRVRVDVELATQERHRPRRVHTQRCRRHRGAYAVLGHLLQQVVRVSDGPPVAVLHHHRRSEEHQLRPHVPVVAAGRQVQHQLHRHVSALDASGRCGCASRLASLQRPVDRRFAHLVGRQPGERQALRLDQATEDTRLQVRGHAGAGMQQRGHRARVPLPLRLRALGRHQRLRHRRRHHAAPAPRGNQGADAVHVEGVVQRQLAAHQRHARAGAQRVPRLRHAHLVAPLGQVLCQRAHHVGDEQRHLGGRVQRRLRRVGH
mmetsp:Transcript_9838/g.30963  ORF Transcript_9838/g.30963 Transcript_9838/m.30963 type:complete len:366 (-) Transcript_9838:4174-5271(-)